MTHVYNRRDIDDYLVIQEAKLQTGQVGGMKGIVPNYPLPPNQEFQFTCQGNTWDEVARKLKMPFPGEEDANNQIPA